MSIRFPDFQILFPRTTEIPRVQPSASEQAHVSLHAQGAQIEQERERKRTTLDKLPESERSWIRRDRRSGGGGSGGRGAPSKKAEADSQGKGRHIDIEA